MFKVLTKKIKDKINNLVNVYQYYSHSGKNFYRCKLVGEKPSDNEHVTTIIYRILGKRDIFEISIEELLANKDLVSQFHPTEAVKFGAIAMGDILFRENESNRKNKFNEIKKKMMEGTRG